MMGGQPARDGPAKPCVRTSSGPVAAGALVPDVDAVDADFGHSG